MRWRILTIEGIVDESKVNRCEIDLVRRAP